VRIVLALVCVPSCDLVLAVVNVAACYQQVTCLLVLDKA